MPTAPESDRAPATDDDRPADDRDRLAALDELTGQPLAAHVVAYEALHTELQHALSEIDGA